MKKILLVSLIFLALFVAGCSSSSSYDYKAPTPSEPAPIGGGCGVGIANNPSAKPADIVTPL